MFSLGLFARRARRDRPLGRAHAQVAPPTARQRHADGRLAISRAPPPIVPSPVPCRPDPPWAPGRHPRPRPPCRRRAVTMQRRPDRLVSNRHQPSPTSQPPSRTYRPRSRLAWVFWFRPLKFRLPAPPQKPNDLAEGVGQRTRVERPELLRPEPRRRTLSSISRPLPAARSSSVWARQRSTRSRNPRQRQPARSTCNGASP
jgi:hypothetical protein